MKKITLFILLVCLSVSAYGQIRDYVFIVRPAYDEQTLAYLQGLAETLEKNGYDGLIEVSEDPEDGRFGSGFLFVGTDGRAYVLTNRHVVAGAASVILQQESADGTSRQLEQNRIVAVDDALDLALLEIKDGADFKEGIVLSEGIPSDGTDIWSAGYPGLGGDPAWQFGKGTITNASARIEELIDPEKSVLIQHSAPVDPGNSGGPLLVASESAPLGYLVVGINTWKAFSRQAANFAVPASTVRGFVERGLSEPDQEQRSSFLSQRTEEFIGLISPREDEDDLLEKVVRISRFISRQYVYDTGEDALLAVLKYAPSDVRSEVIETIVEGSPLEGLRIAVAYEMCKGLENAFGEDAVYMSGSSPIFKDDATAALKFTTAEGEEIDSVWHEENLSWRIHSIDYGVGKPAESEEQKRAISSFSLEEPYVGFLFGEYGISDEMKSMISGGVIFSGQCIAAGAVVGFGKADIDVDENDIFAESSTTSLIRVLGLGRLQFPVVTDTIIVNPFVELRGGVQIATDSDILSGPMGSYGAGLQLGYNGSDMSYILGLAWNKETVISLADTGEDNPSYGLITISFGVGLY